MAKHFFVSPSCLERRPFGSAHRRGGQAGHGHGGPQPTVPPLQASHHHAKGFRYAQEDQGHLRDTKVKRKRRGAEYM